MEQMVDVLPYGTCSTKKRGCVEERHLFFVTPTVTDILHNIGFLTNFTVDTIPIPCPVVTVVRIANHEQLFIEYESGSSSHDTGGFESTTCASD